MKTKSTDRHKYPRKVFHAHPALLDAITEYRRSRDPMPSESEAIRYLIKRALCTVGIKVKIPGPNGRRKSVGSGVDTRMTTP